MSEVERMCPSQKYIGCPFPEVFRVCPALEIGRVGHVRNGEGVSYSEIYRVFFPGSI